MSFIPRIALYPAKPNNGVLSILKELEDELLPSFSKELKYNNRHV